MKSIFAYTLLFLSWCVGRGNLFAQSPTCATATALCDNITPYPATTLGTNAPSGNNYSCLSTTPDPAWFFFTISRSGTIQMDLQNSATVDVDFVLWGPFASVSAAMAQCGNMGNGGAGGNVVDCSYDPQAFESIDIANAVAGQVYVLMVTNYSNSATSIYTQANTGTGDIACPCNIRSRHSLYAGSDGTLISTQDSAAQYGVCVGDTLYFNLGMRSATINDSLGIDATGTTITSAFPAGSYGIYGPFYPVAGRYDTMDILVAVYPSASTVGIRNFNLGIASTNRSTRVICPEIAPVSIIIPGATANDTTICSGQSMQLNTTSIPATSFGSPSYTWTQIGGLPLTLTNANTATPTIAAPVTQSTSSTNQSVLVVQNTYGSCIARDTVVVRYPNVNLALSPNPTSICAGSSVTLSARLNDTLNEVPSCLPSYTLASTTYAPIVGTGTSVSLNDDQVSGALPIGFTFRYYCNNYTNFYISSNGFVTFSASQPSAKNNASIPNTSTPNNIIALGWDDLDPTSGGTIRYFTTGTAPNRKLVVTFTTIPYYYLFIPGGDISVQLVLYETTNVIELHVTNMDDDGTGVTMGIENSGGTAGVPIPGRNNADFSATNEGWRFTPNPGPLTPQPPTYTWSPATGLSSTTIYNPVANPTSNTTYAINVVDGVCRYAGNVTVSTGSVGIAPTVTNATCSNPNAGSATVVASGGVAPYTYAWSNGRTTASNTGLSAGTYTITVRDNNSCTGTANVSIGAPTAPTLTPVVTNATCAGGNGSIALTVTGGTAPYTYVWSNGGNSQNLSNLSAGTYRVTVTDAGACSVVSAAVTVSQPSAPTVAVTSLTNISCNGGSNGAISISVTGGTTPYSYLWSNGATSQNLTSVPAGSYRVTVTTANGCAASSPSVLLTQPTAVTSALVTATQVSCNGGNNGAITTTASGGTTPYTFAWSNGATSQNLANLTQGTYTLSVSDANGCASTPLVVTITQPSAVSTTLASSTQVSCNGGNNGAITISAAGGTTPYTYAWSNGRTTASNTGLTAGSYTVTTTDARGCTSTLVVTISQPSAITISNIAITNAVCNGGTTGAISLSVAGGTTPYTYAWSNGRTTASNTGLAAGTYRLTATDANGCTMATSALSVSQPSAITVSTVSTTVASCGTANGAADISVTGATSPYTYLWSNGATTQDIASVMGGSYVVTVTDANMCASSYTVTINSTGSLSASLTSVTNVTCAGANNGAVNITVSNGTTPYTFAWSNGRTTEDLASIAGGTYSVTVSDASGCRQFISAVSVAEPTAIALSATTTSVTCNSGSNGTATATISGGTTPYTFVWSNGATTQNLTGLAAGTYRLTATDANGCTMATSMLSVSQPSATTISIVSTTTAACGTANGAADISVTGAASPYTYLWSNGATTQDIASVMGGTYVVTVTDANMCTSSRTVIINSTGSLSASLTSVTNVTCAGANNGAVNITVSNGTTPYTFAWSNGRTTEDLASIAGGTYSVTVSDASGCRQFISAVSVAEPTAIALSVVATSVTCNGGSDGTATATVSGGTMPYTFVWSDGSTTQNLISLLAGAYTLTVTDGNGCTRVSNTVAVNQPTAIAFGLGAVTDVTCSNMANGAISTTISGGAAPYTYRWNNGATTANLSGLGSGLYAVTATDGNGCAATLSNINISAPNPVTVDVVGTITMLGCDLVANGAAEAFADGGVSPLRLLWSNGATTSQVGGLAAGTYAVTVTDGNGCTDTAMVTVNAPLVPTLSAFIGQTGTTSASISLGASVALGAGSNQTGVSYAWAATPAATAGLQTPTAPQTTAVPTSATTYTFVVTASATTGTTTCTAMDTVLLTVTDSKFWGLPTAFSPNGDGQNDRYRAVELNPEYIKEFKVYNRWGECLYSNARLTDGGWDGRWKDEDQPRDTYIVVLEYQTPQDNTPIKLRGEFTLLR